MRDAGIGRVLVASLHQGIADVLPARLGFYESWLHAEGLRDGTIGLAPLYAVLSFLRQEGDAYKNITTSAGEYADFSILNVAENSHTLKPLIYKISGVWGNHEGSMMLWILVLGLYTAAIARLFKLFDVKANISVTSCRATGSDHCAMTVTIVPT